MAGTAAVALSLTLLFFFFSHSASGSYPRAQNVTWKSTNFKTILTWQPKPLSDYSYTVEFNEVGGDKKRNSLCIRSMATMCDLSSSLTDLKACYTADVISEPLPGVASDLIEFPYTSSSRFCPYEDTDLVRPEFKLEVSEDQRTTTLYVTDPPTALFKDDDHQLNIRDIFSDQLHYKVTYRRNQSTGKKTHISKSSVIPLPNLDKGESYCFTVQAYIPSRALGKQLGEPSATQCTVDTNKGILEVFSVGVIAGAILLILLVVGLITAVTVICCKHRKKNLRKEKEGLPLRDV